MAKPKDFDKLSVSQPRYKAEEFEPSSDGRRPLSVSEYLNFVVRMPPAESVDVDVAVTNLVLSGLSGGDADKSGPLDLAAVESPGMLSAEERAARGRLYQLSPLPGKKAPAFAGSRSRSNSYDSYSSNDEPRVPTPPPVDDEPPKRRLGLAAFTLPTGPKAVKAVALPNIEVSSAAPGSAAEGSTPSPADLQSASDFRNSLKSFVIPGAKKVPGLRKEDSMDQLLEKVHVHDSDASLFEALDDADGPKPSPLVDSAGNLDDEENGLRMNKFGFSVLTASTQGLPQGLVSPRISKDLMDKLDAAAAGQGMTGVAYDELEPVGKLGSGSGGTVHKVRHKPTGKLMAEKTIPLAMNAMIRKQIARELRILNRCQSPYIVEFKGAFFNEGNIQIVMEYMDAGSLRGMYFAAGAFPEAAVACVARNMLHGLDYLKTQLNVMHRDVKPENVLLSMSGEVKLCDFGVCANLVNSLASTCVGTQLYFAPERLNHSSEGPQPYNVQADIWCFGLTIAEVMLGRFPYPLADESKIDAPPPKKGLPPPKMGLMELLHCFLFEPAPTLPKRFSEPCRDFIGRCLLKDPLVRPGPAELLEHEFMKMHLDFDMGAWVRSVLPAPDAAAVAADPATRSVVHVA